MPAADPFAKFDPDQVGELPPDQSSVTGAFARSAVRGVAPAIGGLAGAGAGAEIGAAIGAFGGPLAPFTVPAGFLVGGIFGGLAGGYATSKAQDYALSAAPDSWREAIGQDDRQQQLDQKDHPYASFIGGISPFVLTMRPGFSAAEAALPGDATNFQRLMANPTVHRLFGGGVMGGVELAQEAAQGERPDWMKVAVSTGFGVVFNKPTRLGESITELGARPVRAFLPASSAEVGPPAIADRIEPTMEPGAGADGEQRPLTVAAAGDLKVMGPGITEGVFRGDHEQDPAFAQTAQEAARTEQALIGEPPPGPDVHDVVRQMHPDLFVQYDGLAAQRETLRDLIQQHNNPPDDAFAELAAQRGSLEGRLETIPTSGAGRNLPEARRVRAQIRDVQSQLDDLQGRRDAFARGQGEDTLEASIARQHLIDVDYQMRDLAPDVSAAYRRAADATSSSILLPRDETPSPAEGALSPPFDSLADMIAVAQDRPRDAAPPTARTSESTAAEPLASDTAPAAAADAPPADRKVSDASSTADDAQRQRDFIANDVMRRLVVAGRPAEEAAASGQLLAARYLTRAARFNGALGTAEDLYARNGAAIRSPGTRTLKPAGAPVEVRAPRTPGRRADGEPQSLVAFLRAAGGLKDDAGELRARDMHRQFPGLVNNARGLGLDSAREMAAEAGYLGADTTRAVSETGVNDLLEALDNHPVYSVRDETRLMELARRRSAKPTRTSHARPPMRWRPRRKASRSNMPRMSTRPASSTGSTISSGIKRYRSTVN